MLNLIFSEPGHVYIQGPHVLRYINRNEKFVEYSVLGFEDQVILRDFRCNGLRAIDYVIETQDTARFPEYFIGSGQISVFDLMDDQPVTIELRDTTLIPQFLLWVNIGFNGYVPAFEYDISYVQKIDDSKFALIAILDMQKNEIDIFDYSLKPSLLSNPTPYSKSIITCVAN